MKYTHTQCDQRKYVTFNRYNFVSLYFYVQFQSIIGDVIGCAIGRFLYDHYFEVGAVNSQVLTNIGVVRNQVASVWLNIL